MDQRERLEDPIEALKAALDIRQASIWTAMPAKVISYDPVTVTVKCQLTIQLRVIDQQGNISWHTVPILGEVPVCFPKAGGFRITFPLNKGDNVLVIFSSRCIDGWWANDPPVDDTQSIQFEMRMHDLSDGFAIPGPYSRPEAQSVTVDSENLEISTEDGQTKIQITPSGTINVQALQVNILSDDISLGVHTEDPNSFLVRVSDLQQDTNGLIALIQAAFNQLSARIAGGGGVAPPIIGTQTVSGTTKVKGV